jgi:hypothetical protein
MFTAYSVCLKFSKVWERNNTNRKIRYEPFPLQPQVVSEGGFTSPPGYNGV